MPDKGNETVTPSKEYILRILSGPHTGAEVALSQDKKLLLGKGEDCDIVLKDDRLADQHALFSFQEDHFVCAPAENAEITIDGEVIREAKALKNFAAIICAQSQRLNREQQAPHTTGLCNAQNNPSKAD